MQNTKFFEPPSYNLDGRQSLWIECCTNSHDTWCGCNWPIAHLLSALLPPGHEDRSLTVQQIIDKAYTQKWPSGGKEEGAGTTGEADLGERDAEPSIEDLEDVFGDNAIEELLTAAAEDAAPR